MSENSESNPSEEPVDATGSDGSEANTADSAPAESGSSEPAEASQIPEEALAASEQEIRDELGIGGAGVDMGQDDIEALLAAATAEDAALTTDLATSASGETSSAPHIVGGAVIDSKNGGVLDQNLQLLRDVHMKVKVELGRGHMYLKDILRLGQGSVVELERLAGDPLDIYVNDKVIARGEVLVLNESFCIRITEVFNPEELRQAM